MGLGMFAILGATGKVGRQTIRRLRARGEAVRAVVRDPARAADLAASGCGVAICDLHDAEAVLRAVDGARAVQVICPVPARAADPAQDMRTVIDAIGAALERARPEAVVAVSDYGAEIPTGTGITLLFHYLESRLARLPAATTFLRSAEHMQNWARQVKATAQTGVLGTLHHPVTKPFPTVSAGDVGVVAAEVLMSPVASSLPRIVHVEGPRRYTPVDVAAALGELLGREVVARELPRPEWHAILVGGGLTDGHARLIEELCDAHNAGRIDVDKDVGEVRRGTTELTEALAPLVRRA